MRETPPGTRRRLRAGLTLLLPLFALPACPRSSTTAPADPFTITEAKTCLAFDENRKPLKVTSEFPAGTQIVHCWFSWRDAKPNTQILTRWYYTSENLSILNFPVTLPRKSNDGVVSLQMPKGKNLPAGSYRVDFSLLNNEKQILQSTSFTVFEPNRPSADHGGSEAVQSVSPPPKAPPSDR